MFEQSKFFPASGECELCSKKKGGSILYKLEKLINQGESH